MNEIQYAIAKALQTFEPSTMKIVVASLTSILFFFFGNLYTDALVAIAMLMVFDTVFAIAASYKEGQPITSRRFSRSLFKGIVYFLSISAGYFADLTMPLNLIQGTMVAFVGATEFISILENMSRLGYQTPKKLLGQLKDFKSQK